MSTTCQDVVTRAQAFGVSNSPLTNNAMEMLTRIRADQDALFSKVAEVNRDYFSTYASITSTNGSSLRTFDISTVSPPVERTLKVTLADGRLLNQVDPLDLDGELAPRYVSQGMTLLELTNEWSSTSGTVSASLYYVHAPIDIDPLGALTQLISIPDKYSDLPVISLAQYLHHKDVGRDPLEGQRLQALYSDRLNDFFNYLSHFAGVEARRFDIPRPSGSKS